MKSSSISIILLGLWITVFLGFSAAGAPLSLRYSTRTWQISEGLPNDTVQALTQTHDGYFWIGTPEGLSRFDGVKFTVIKEMQNRFVTALCEGTQQDLWIGTRGGLVRWKDGKFTYFTSTNEMAGRFVQSLLLSSDGTLWVGTISGVSFFKNEKMERVPPTSALYAVSTRSMAEDGQHTIWFGTDKGLYASGGGGANTTVIQKNDFTKIRALYCEKSGQLWIGAKATLFRDLVENAAQPRNVAGFNRIIVTAVLRDRSGHSWVGTYGGLYQVSDDLMSVTEIKNEEEPFDFIYAIYEDREGNLWVGSKEGLSCLKPKAFYTYTKQQGLSHNNVTSIVQDHSGAMWIGTWGGGLNQMKGETFNNDLPAMMITGLAEDRSGRMWFGKDWLVGLYAREGTNLTRYGTKDGLLTHVTQVIHQDKGGRIWFGTRDGLYRYYDQKFYRYSTKQGLAGNSIRDLKEAADGTLWIGTDAGVSRWDGKTFRKITAKDGLTGGQVNCLYEDVDKSFWVGTSAGLTCIRSNLCYPVTKEMGFLPQPIVSILQDDEGRLWLGSREGIFSVWAQELNGALQNHTPFHAVAYDTTDGLVSSRCNVVAQPATWKSKDGKLWFATAKGLATIEPSRARQVNQVAPPVIIEDVVLDGKVISDRRLPFSADADDADRSIEILPGHGELAIHYTGLSFTAPEKNRFKYKLDGIDADWVDAGARRVASYRNVSPGRYRFAVIACNNDGIWNETGASLRVTFLPHFWQTKSFFVLMVLAGIALVAGAVRYIIWRKWQGRLKYLEQQNALEKERGRIARDMHDGLGVRLTEILLLSNLTRKNGMDAGEIREHNHRIATAAKDVISHLDNIVWAINPENDSLERFAGYLYEQIETLLKSTSLRCRWRVPTDLPDRPLSSDVRHQLFLVCNEALNNVVKYSEASEVKFGLQIENDVLVIIVEDNGKGFSLEETSRFGNGLKNMEKRMHQIGGAFVITSQPGKGTSVEFKLRLER